MANLAAPPQTYSIIRGQVEHVDNNLSQRVIWLVIAQSFFFSGFAVLINGKPALPELNPVHQALVHILPIAALVTILFTSIDVVTSLTYMKSLREKYEASLDDETKPIDDIYPTITGSKRQRIFMHASPILIPLLFIVVWVILIICQYTHNTPPPPPPPQ